MEQARIKLAAAAAALLVAGLLVALALAGQSEPSDFASGGKAPPQEITDLPRAVRNAGCELRDFPEEGDGETAEPVSYRSDPPHSGPHHPQPAEDAAYYDEPPVDGSVVHALRHGRIAIWFDPDLSEDEKADLNALFEEDVPHMLLLPDDSMPYEVAATGWTHRLGCEELGRASFDALRAFRKRYRDRGPEFVP
jgi:hypothetical protein